MYTHNAHTWRMGITNPGKHLFAIVAWEEDKKTFATSRPPQQQRARRTPINVGAFYGFPGLITKTGNK